MKSTIPEGIVEFLQLQEKDELEWHMDMKNSERVAIVTKKTSTNSRSLHPATKTALKHSTKKLLEQKSKNEVKV